MSAVERPTAQQILNRLAQIAQELNSAPPWIQDSLIAEQQRLLAELRKLRA
jgi:hypothetical protein